MIRWIGRMFGPRGSIMKQRGETWFPTQEDQDLIDARKEAAKASARLTAAIASANGARPHWLEAALYRLSDPPSPGSNDLHKELPL